MEIKQKVPNRNVSVDLLRLLLIFLIVIHHYTYRYTLLYPEVDFSFRFDVGGFVGNYMFMFVSGYFLANSFLKGSGGNAWKKYVVNHWWRLFPIAAISTTIIFVVTSLIPLSGRSVSLQELFLNWLIIHPNIPYVDGAHWFISSLLQMQLLLSIVLFISDKKKRTLAIVIVCIISMCLHLLYDMPETRLDNILYGITCSKWLPVLLSGCIASLAFSSNISKWFVVIPVLWTTYMVILHSSWLLAIMFVLFTIIVLCGDSIFSRLSPIANTIGVLSFVWYLLHQNIGYCIMNVLRNANIESEFTLVGVAAVSTLFISILLTIGVQKIPTRLIK